MIQFKNFLTYKYIKLFLSFIVFLLLALLVINGQVKSKIIKAIDRVPNLTSSEVSVNLITGCAFTDSLFIQLDTKDSTRVLLDMRGVSIHDVSYWDLIVNDRLDIEKIRCQNLDLKQKTLISKASKKEEKKAKRQFLEIRVGSIAIDNGNLESRILKTDFQLNSFSIDARGIIIQHTDSLNIQWSSLNFNASNFFYDKKTANHFLKTGGIKQINGDLVVNDLELIPKRSKENFIAPLPYKKIRIDLQVDKINFKIPDYQKLIVDRKVLIQKVIAEKLNLSLYNDNDNDKEKCQSCFKKYYHEMLHELQLPLKVDTILIKDSTVEFEELQNGNQEAAALKWDQVYASIFNISNLSKNNTLAYVDINAQFMKKSKVQLHFEFPIFNPDMSFTFKGTLESMKLKALNRFLTFSKQVRIDDGDLEHLEFSGNGNKTEWNGDIIMRYRNLKIEILNKDRKAKKIFSGLANLLLSRDNNPKKDEVRVGKMYSKREQNRGFFGNFWLTLQSGIKSTVLPNLFLDDKLDVEKIEDI